MKIDWRTKSKYEYDFHACDPRQPDGECPFDYSGFMQFRREAPLGVPRLVWRRSTLRLPLH